MFGAKTNIKSACACYNSSTGTCGGCSTTETCCLDKCQGYPYLQFRSQGRDISRQFAGLEQFMYKFGTSKTYGIFSPTIEYSQAFDNKKISHFLFGSDLINSSNLYIQGSQIENRNPKAWLADYFGLPSDFSSIVKFCPTVKNIVIDLNFYIGLDELATGLFLQIDAPFVWTEWQLNQCEQLISTGTANYSAGYMSDSEINRASLAGSFLQAMTGGYTFGDLKIPIRYGKINNCDNSTKNFAEIDLYLGYNFLLNKDSHVGAFVYGSAPTGTRPSAVKLFEPVLGNGKHWELGVGLTASHIFYRSEENEQRFIGIYFDAIVGHLFKTLQVRSFDLCGKQNSRYMLLQEITTADGNLTGQNPTYTPAETQYAKTMIPAINLFTFNIKTQIGVQADASIKLAASRDNASFDLGYNLWARNGETFTSFSTCPCDTNRKYALKGDATLYGQYTDGIPTATIVQILQSESCSTIHGPQTDCDTNLTIIDNPELAFYTVNGAHKQVTQIDGQQQLYTSIQPIRVSRNMLNTSKSPSAITHKIFGNFEYAWKEHEKNTPFICIGAKVEFSQDRYKDCCKSSGTCSNNNNCLNNNCSGQGCNQLVSCGPRVFLKEQVSPRIALNQWGVWVKGGVAFN